jgi:hypothetical protein
MSDSSLDGEAPWWSRAPIRLLVLLGLLGVVAAFGAHTWLSGGPGRASPSASVSESAGCYATSAHPLARWPAAEVEHAVDAAGLRWLVGAGRLDIGGPEDPMVAWSDQYPSDASPHDPFLVPALAGYEIRWWSPEGLHEEADLFVFATAGQAERYVRQATSTRCRHHGTISHPIAQPAGAASLVWDNPLGYLQADLFFARGNRAYRVGVVPPGSAGEAPDEADASGLLKTLQENACGLTGAGCRAGA